jgi:hypothetical protein
MPLRVAMLILTALAMAACANGGLFAARPLIEPRYDCTLQESIAVDANELVRSPGTFVGKCVRTIGYVDRSLFYPNLDILYSNREPFLATNLAALYGSVSVSNKIDLQRRYVEVIAFVSNCVEYRRFSNEEIRRIVTPPDQVLVHSDDSFCAFVQRPVPVLYVSSWQELGGQTLRYSGKDAALKYGDITPIDEAWQYADEVTRVGNNWFNAVQNRDKSKLLDRFQAEDLLDDETTPFQFLLSAPELPPVMYFSAKPPLLEAARVKYTAYGCVCKSGDCANEWPISSLDTNSSVGQWPYLCITIRKFADESPSESPNVTFDWYRPADIAEINALTDEQ